METVFSATYERYIHVYRTLMQVLDGRAMFQAVSCLLITAETGGRYRLSPCEICGGNSGTGTGFSQITSIVFYQYHSTNTPCPALSLHYTFQ